MCVCVCGVGVYEEFVYMCVCEECVDPVSVRGTGEGARQKVLPTESQQILGGERTIPGPQHIRKCHRDRGRD